MSDGHAEVIGCSRSLLPICNLWRVKDSAQMCSQTGNPQHFFLSVPSKITSCFTDQGTYHINIMECCDIILFVKIFLLTKCGGTATSESGFFIYFFIKSNFHTKYVKSSRILGHWLEQELFCLNKWNAANLFTTAFAFHYQY